MAFEDELNKNEKLLQVVKPHPLSYLSKYILAGFATFFLLLIFGTLGFVLGLILFLVIELVRRNNRYYVTNSRVAHDFTFYFIARKTSSTVYNKIQDLHLFQGLIGRIFNIGTLKINTAGSHIVEITFEGIKNPLLIKKLVEKHLTPRL